MARRNLWGALAVDSDAVRVGEHTIAQKDVEQGYIDPGPPIRVVVTTRSGEYAIEVESLSTAHTALAALGVAVEQRALHFETVGLGTRLAYVLGVLLTMVALASGVGKMLGHLPSPLVWAFVLATTLLALIVGRRRSPIDIGVDGVRFKGKFIELGDIRAARADVQKCTLGHANCFEAKVVLSTSEGEVTVPFPIDDPTAGERARAMAERVTEALASPTAATPANSILDARVDDVAHWREQLWALARDSEGYRNDALDADEMSRVLEDPHAPQQRRLGAAIALHATGVADASARIRVCADATAEPHLRVALERIAAGEADDELIARALRHPAG